MLMATFITAIKLFDAEKSPEKYYKVTISTTGLVSIYENIQGSQFLFGTFNRETVQVKGNLIDPSEFSPSMFQGFYVRYNIGKTKKGNFSTCLLSILPLILPNKTLCLLSFPYKNASVEIYSGS